MERLLASSQVEDFLARLRESIAQSEAVGIVSVEAAGEEWSGQEADVGLRRPLVNASGEVPGMEASKGNDHRESLRNIPSPYSDSAGQAGQQPQADTAHKEPGGFDTIYSSHLVTEGSAEASSQRALRRSTETFHGASDGNQELGRETFQPEKPLAVPETPLLQKGSTPRALDTMQSAFKKFEHAEMQGGSQPTEILDSQEESFAGKVSSFMSPQLMHQSRQVAMHPPERGTHRPDLLQRTQPVLSSFPQPFRPPNRPADIMTGQSAPFYGYYAGGNQAGQSSNPVTFSGSFPPRQVQHSPETPGVFSRTKELEALESVAAQNLKQRMILKWQLDIRASILRAQLEETEQEMQKNATELGFAGRQAQEIRDLRRQIDLNSMHVYQPPSSNSGGGPFAESERNLPPWEQAEQTRNSQVLLGAFVQRGALAASSAPLPPEELATRIASLGKDVAVGSVGDRQPLSPQPFLTPSKVTQEGSQIAHGKDAAGDEEGGEELVKRATSQAEDKGSRQEVVPDNSFSEGAGKAVKEPEENRAKQDVPIVGVETAGRSEVAGGNATGQKGAVAENQTKPQPGEGSSVSKRVQNEEEKEGRSEDQRKEEQKPNSTSAAPESRTESVHERRQSSGSKAERVATVEAPVPESERRPQIARRNADEGKRPEKDVQRSRESGGGRQEDAEKERGRPERVHHAGRVGEMLSEEKGRWMEKRKSPTTGISGAPAEKLKSSQVEYQMLQLKRRRWETPRKESDRQPQK